MPYKNRGAWARRFYHVTVPVPACYQNLPELEAMRLLRKSSIWKAKQMATTETDWDFWDSWPVGGSIEEGQVQYRVLRKRRKAMVA